MGKGNIVNSDVGVDVLENTRTEEVVKGGGKGEKKSLLSWKAPLGLLKMCALRVSPIWTFSIAAAVVMGVVILTRRLYKIKHKSRALQFKVTQDDKVSHLMSRAAQFNEAFSVVKRLPVIRPALPTAGGLTQWPVISLR